MQRAAAWRFADAPKTAKLAHEVSFHQDVKDCLKCSGGKGPIHEKDPIYERPTHQNIASEVGPLAAGGAGAAAAAQRRRQLGAVDGPVAANQKS